LSCAATGISLIWISVLATVVYLLWKCVQSQRSLLPDYISGPTPESWLLGNQPDIALSEVGKANNRWKHMYGLVYKFRSCFGREFLVLNDANAMQFVLKGQNDSFLFEKSLREFVRLIAGEGLVYMQGTAHTRRKRLLQPAFTPLFVKGLTPKFVSCVVRLVAEWERHIASADSGGETWSTDICHWMERLTSEAVGLASFGVEFGALEGGSHDLQEAYAGLVSKSFSHVTRFSIVLGAIMMYLPTWLIFVTDKLPLPATRRLRLAKQVIHRYTMRLIEDKRQQLARDKRVDRDSDVLTALTHANMASDKSAEHQLTDEELYHELNTIFFAGFETVTNSISFGLLELARHPGVQTQLYEEVISVLGSPKNHDLHDGFDHSTVEAMPYLIAVVNEILRLHSAVHSVMLVASREIVIPLSRPIFTKDDRKIGAIPVKKGQRILCHLDGFNHLEEVWGSDSNDFKPERWLDRDEMSVEPQDSCGTPYANVATFGAGPKVCLGWRFAVLEMQVFIAMIVRQFELSISDPDYVLWRDGSFAGAIPMQKGHLEKGPHVPLKITRRH